MRATVRSSNLVSAIPLTDSTSARRESSGDEALVVDRLAVHRDALVDRVQVGAGEGAHPKTRRLEQRTGERRGRAFAVRAGDVDGRVVELGIGAAGPGCRRSAARVGTAWRLGATRSKSTCDSSQVSASTYEVKRTG